jgi:hypothetical protein
MFSLDTATCRSSSTTDTCMTSVKGFGYRPIHSTAAASRPSIRNSRPLMSFSALTLSLATSPKYTRLTIHSV